MTQRGSSELLTTEEVQHVLQINQRTLYRLAKNGEIPALRVGRQWRFRQSDIEEWIDTRRLPGTLPAGDFAGPFDLDPDDAAASAVEPVDGHILIVDADQETRRQLSRSLTGLGYRVDTAEDAASAMEYLGMLTYDLIITEVNGPGLDGLALIGEARRQRPNLPAIIVTAHSTEGAAIESANLGVAGYFTKPLMMGRVMAALVRALGN